MSYFTHTLIGYIGNLKNQKEKGKQKRNEKEN